MIYRQCDMIYGKPYDIMIYLRCKYIIISVPSYAAGIYHPRKWISYPEDISPVRAKERISLQKGRLNGV